jgi:hypothetical protein
MLSTMPPAALASAGAASKRRLHLRSPVSGPGQIFAGDHKRLTYRFQGRDFRLTDVHGEIVEGIIA